MLPDLTARPARETRAPAPQARAETRRPDPVTDRPLGAFAAADLLVDAGRAAEMRRQSADWPSWDLSPSQECDLELLVSGGFSPLRGYLGQAEYESVCADMRLGDGTLWPVPVTLDVDEAMARRLSPGLTLGLRDAEGVLLAAVEVEELWQPDPKAEAPSLYGLSDRRHAGVEQLLRRTDSWCVAGRVAAVQLPVHYDFVGLRRTPAQLRTALADCGWRRTLAYPTDRPLHRLELDGSVALAAELDAGVLVHGVVGPGRHGGVDHYTRVRCWQALLPSYPDGRALLSLLPLTERATGLRRALWRVLVERNFGATHVLLDPRTEVRPGTSRADQDADELFLRHVAELGVSVVMMPQPAGGDQRRTSAAVLRQRLDDGSELPESFTPAAVATELRRQHPPRPEQGLTVFFTGLSGSGKSTVANVVLVKLLERGGRAVTLLDGDVVRKHLSSELGFSKHHRDINVRRIGYVASEITKHGGIAICAPIAPYDATRRDVRAMVEQHGGFVLVHVATPVEVCEQRDRKGLYAKARAGVLTEFTGISDPYEEPADADLVLDTTGLSTEAAAAAVIEHLERAGFLPPPATDGGVSH